MLICEGLFFLVGVIALITGKFRLYGKRTVQGPRARITGLVLMLPGPIAVGMGLLLGFMGGVSQDTINALSIFEALMLVAAFVIAAILALSAPGTNTEAAPAGIDPGQPVEDTSQKLQQLKEMLDQGLITVDEYQQKRSEIITKM